MNGQTQQVKPGDMFVRDRKGIISSIIYGPDQRTKITGKTKNAIFTVYAPVGVEKERIPHHLKDIADYVLLATPEAKTEVIAVYKA